MLLKMASTKPLLLLLLLCFSLSTVSHCESTPRDDTHELTLLKSKLHTLEEGLKSKESKINELEHELTTLRSRDVSQLKVDSAMSKIRELESQVQSLQDESAKLKTEADLHANHAKTVSETASSHLSEKEKAIKALEDQKLRLQKAERGLQIAEAAMLKAKAEAEEKARKLDDLHQSWLPPWAATHAETLQKTASSRWSTHGEPVVKELKRTASSKVGDAHGYVKPHLDTFHKKVKPAIREKWEKVVVAVAPHIEKVKKGVESGREYIAPHVETVQKTVNPYVESVKEKSKPYIDQAKTCAAPHLERVQTLAGPHYRRAVTAAYDYHSQVQRQLEGKLGNYKFATKQFIWFLAAAILALPFVTVFMFLRSLLSSPTKSVHHKRHRSSHSGSSSHSKKPRRSKQADKQFEK